MTLVIMAFVTVCLEVVHIVVTKVTVCLEVVHIVVTKVTVCLEVVPIVVTKVTVCLEVVPIVATKLMMIKVIVCSDSYTFCVFYILTLHSCSFVNILSLEDTVNLT